MAMLITSIAAVKAQLPDHGFLLFCSEQGIDPTNWVEPEEGVCIDKLDLYRYGAIEMAQDLTASVNQLKSDLNLK